MGRWHGMIKHERSDLTTIKASLFLECTAGSGFFFSVLLPKDNHTIFLQPSIKGLQDKQSGKKALYQGLKVMGQKNVVGT